jgi:hypothetical protein
MLIKILIILKYLISKLKYITIIIIILKFFAINIKTYIDRIEILFYIFFCIIIYDLQCHDAPATWVQIT